MGGELDPEVHAPIKEQARGWVDYTLEFHSKESRGLAEETNIACLRQRLWFVL